MRRGRPLPNIMVAPNGARRTKADHPALPISIEETLETALACQVAGADGLHLHIRDENGGHSLDTGLYREAIAAITAAAPDLFVQATSEAAGRYSAKDQRDMIRDLAPASVSIALREMIRTAEDRSEASALYAWCADNDVSVQHIAYTPQELDWLVDCFDNDIIPGDVHQIQLVLGSYSSIEPPAPTLIGAYNARLSAASQRYDLDWMVCAFGPSETRCLAEAAGAGGKVRVGFENSLWNTDGTLAADNADRVSRVKAAIASATRTAAAQTVSPSDR